MIRLAHLRSVFRRKRFEQDLDDEFQFHLHRQIEAYTAEGMSPEDAHYAALRALGGLQQRKEECREARKLEFFDHLRRDLSYALRMLRTNSAFTFTAVATLALGIGANSAIFSAVNAILYHPAGVSQPERVVAVRMSVEKANLRNSVISPGDFADVRDSEEIFATAGISKGEDFSFTGGNTPERLAGLRISWQWFDVFPAKPILGRLFRPEEDQPNANQVVILSHSTWLYLFGGDPSIVGRTIQLNQLPFKVVGVMGPECDQGITDSSGVISRRDVFVPLGLPAVAYSPARRFNQAYLGLARLEPGVSFDRAQAFMKVLTERAFQAPNGDGAKKQGWSLFLVPYTEFVAGDMRTPMFVLLGAIGFVLLIACSNIAGLMLARASGRSREFAVRTALGATGWHLAQQALVESLVLAVGGSIFGFVVAYACVRAAMVFGPESIVGRLNIQLDIRMLLFTMSAGILSGILFGVGPAYQMTRTSAHDVLKDGGRSGTSGRARLRLRCLLVTTEVALALVLLVGAGLFVRSLLQLQRVNLGFQPQGVTTGILTLPESRYREPEKQIAFYRAVVERLASLPGVTSATAAMPIPFVGGSAGNFRILGRPLQEGQPEPHADVRWVTPGIFSTLHIPLKSGRPFTDFDTANTEDVAIVDETAARQYWPNEDPIGQEIQHYDGKGPSRIVGIVGHVKSSALADGSDRGVIYHSMYQRPLRVATLALRTDANTSGLENALVEAVRSIDPSQPVYDIQTMEERVSATLSLRRFAVLLLGLFASIAMLMAALGLYGVINYGVSQRTQEIGIRIALGAHRGEVLRLIIGQGLRMSLIGIGVGLLAAVPLARLISGQLFKVAPFDPPTLIGMALALLAVALVATYIPARRAASVDPITALRQE